MYRLDFSETSSLMRGKAFHSLDVRMVWDRPSPLAANAAAEAALAMQMFGSWVAFIKGEQPSAAGVPFWPEYNSSSRPTMVFDTQNHVDEKPQEAELRLWDGVL
jgi:para-nitrobenzyl esterase